MNISEYLPIIHNTLPKLAAGYVRLITDKNMEMTGNEHKTIAVEGIMGFNEEFVRELRVVINNCNTRILKIRGHGVMPMLMVSDRKISTIWRNQDEIMDEYRLLQRIYYFDVFKGITMEEDDGLFRAMAEEEISMEKITSRTPTLSYSSDTQQSEQQERENLTFYRVVRTYVFVYNNQDVPNVSVLEQLLETERFLNSLRLESEKRQQLNTVYQNYQQTCHLFREKLYQNVKYFQIQPLPFELRGRILDLGDIYMDEYRRVTLELEFSGPGKLIACARSAIYLQGFTVDLELFDR